MAQATNLWYRLGYALESARTERPVARLRSLAERHADRSERGDPGDRNGRGKRGHRGEGTVRGRRTKDDRPERPEPGAEPVDVAAGPLELALAAGAGTLVARLLGAWPGRGRPGFGGLLRAAAAGAGAALVREVGARFMGNGLELSEWREALPERMAAGSARGVLYATILEPRVPGPPLARAAFYGWAEHALTPLGGLRKLLGGHAPYRSVPLVGELLDEAHAGEDTLADHLVFALALGVLYGGGGPARIGMGEDAE